MLARREAGGRRVTDLNELRVRQALLRLVVEHILAVDLETFIKGSDGSCEDDLRKRRLHRVGRRRHGLDVITELIDPPLALIPSHCRGFQRTGRGDKHGPDRVSERFAERQEAAVVRRRG